MKAFIFFCVLALASSSVLSLSARNAQVMAALEQLEGVLNNQLLSEIVQAQDYNEEAGKEELITALQRACNRGAGAHIQSLSAIANMLSRDEVTTQEAMDIIQAQGLYDLIEQQGLPGAVSVLPPIQGDMKKALKKVTEDKVKEELKKEVEKETEKELVETILTSPSPFKRRGAIRGDPRKKAEETIKKEIVKKVLKGAEKPGELLSMLSGLVGLLDTEVEAQYYK